MRSKKHNVGKVYRLYLTEEKRKTLLEHDVTMVACKGSRSSHRDYDGGKRSETKPSLITSY